MASEITSTCFLNCHIYTFKGTGLLGTLELLSIHVTSRNHHWENTGSTELYTSNYHISYKTQNIVFIKITTGLVKTINYWKIQSQIADKSFPKLLIFAWKFNFYHWQIQLFFLRQQSAYTDLPEKYLPYTQVWMPQLITLFF